MTKGEDFMYDTGTDLTGREFKYSQINLKNPRPLNPFMFAVVYWNHGGFQYSNASHNLNSTKKSSRSHIISHPKGLKPEKFYVRMSFRIRKGLMRTKKGLGGLPPVSIA